jgi:hypothetical protein
LTKPTDEPAQARKSALSVGVVFLLIALWNVWRGRPGIWIPAGTLGIFLLLTGQFWKMGALHFHRGWMRFALTLGYVNSRILLSLMFYLIITPFGVVSRLVGRNPLRRRGPKQQSYWIPRSRPRQPQAQFERLF